MNILITGAGGPAGQALTRQLSERSHVLVGVDMNPVADGALSGFHLVPAATDPGMLPRLREIIAEEDIDLLIPTVAEELTIVAEAASHDFFGCSVVIGPAQGVADAHDKYLTMQRLSAAGVPTPDFALPSEFGSAQEAFDRFGSPLLVKPRVGRGSRGVRVIHAEEGIDWHTLEDDLIVQEFAPGEEFAPMVHVSVRNERSQVGVVAKIKTPGCASAGGYVKEVPAGHAADVASVALSAVQAMGLTGPVDLDLRRNRRGVPVVLEVNARFGANSEYFPGLVDAVLDDYAALNDYPFVPRVDEQNVLGAEKTLPWALDMREVEHGVQPR